MFTTAVGSNNFPQYKHFDYILHNLKGSTVSSSKIISWTITSYFNVGVLSVC